MAKKKVLVEIFCYQKITYRQQVEMEADDFEILKESGGDDVGESGNPKAYYLLNDYINPTDIYDSLNEFEGVEVIEVKKKKGVRK
jgi:hypothetical protein